MCADYWMSQGKYEEANVFESRFEQGIEKMVKSLSIRDREIMGYITE